MRARAGVRRKNRAQAAATRKLAARCARELGLAVGWSLDDARGGLLVCTSFSSFDRLTRDGLADAAAERILVGLAKQPFDLG